MKVGDLLESRRANWRELEELSERVQRGSRRPLEARAVARFSALYRAACADLALADAYQLPPAATEYLHRLVGRAHNQLYRSRTFTVSSWAGRLLVDVPRRLFRDNCLRLAFCVFWGMFLLSAFLAHGTPGYAERVMGKEFVMQLEESFSEPPEGRNRGLAGGMAGFYVFNNVSIGLRCFAFGLLFGVGGLYATLFNAALLGAAFGHMATVQQSGNFFRFVTAHGPFELTAVVLSAAAGMRLGFSLVDTKGRTRIGSLRRSAEEVMPTMGVAVVMFLAAALIEAFLSPSVAPYWIKASVGVFSVGLLIVYFLVLGYAREK